MNKNLKKYLRYIIYMTPKIKSYQMLLVLISVLVPQTLYANDKDRVIYFHLEKVGQFEVLYERAISTVTGAVLFGFVGAAIEGGVDSSNDTEKEKILLEILADSKCDELLVASMKDTFEKNGTYLVYDTDKEEHDFPYVLTLRIDSCGFRIVNSVNYKVASYVDIKIDLQSEENKQSLYKDKIIIYGKEKLLFSDLSSDTDTLKHEFEYVLTKAGKRVANKIIYLEGE